MDFIEFINKIDREFFILIHVKYAYPSLDFIMLLLREGKVWIPLYVGLLIWIIRKHKKSMLPFILFSVITFAITDFVSASILKPFFERPRPCYDEQLQGMLRNILACGGRFGFPSSHASNHFGLACFWFTTVKLLDNKKWYWLWIWAVIICYAQVYVGKHYPFDIVGGALFGIVTGLLTALVFRHWHLGNIQPALLKLVRFKKHNKAHYPVTS